MAEIDYQLALLLQHKFEQEAKKPKVYESDLEFARTLHEQFQAENEINSPNNGLSYNKSTNTSLNSSKCLVDPSWEVIDPTPDIYVLFMSFNDRFFWGKLVTVCVSWSKRMTTCAGICSYQGRGGMCSITLSEPLLKLRPRKDLVETLLHEMIHAYLFVTNNNRDRDGHGPEFHSHMWRINKDAGTNISVYHDFHDEVRLYQQHWWRCDGPCQNRRPYFGMVRRATNRAPGPYDRWWGEHSRSCGGNFVKVKEPEKPAKKSSTKENVKPKEDIRKYFPTGKNSPSQIKTQSTSTVTSKTSNANRNSLSNIHTLRNNDNNKQVGTVIPKANNIFGFNNLSGNANSSKAKGGGAAIKNNSNTIVINKKPTTSRKTEVVKPNNVETGRILSDASESNNITIDYSLVRNHWLNKFPNGVKRSVSSESGASSVKTPKLNTSEKGITPPRTESTGNCPVCFEPVPVSQLNDHLDQCLETPKLKKCMICGNDFPLAEIECHVARCMDSDDVVFVADQTQCAACNKSFPKSEFDAHVAKCVLKPFDAIEDEVHGKAEHVDCLACGKSIVKAELNAHLEYCMSLSRVFEDDNCPEEGEDASNCDSRGNKYNCPCCMAEIFEKEMNDHIDVCLGMKSRCGMDSEVVLLDEGC